MIREQDRKIITLKYGESVFHENCIFRGGRPDVLLPISFVIYLIQDRGRNILVDTGCNDGAGFHMSVFARPVDLLKQYGVLPEEISDIVITHHHHDHIEAVKDYPNAIIHIQRQEYELGKNYIPKNHKIELFDKEKVLAEGLTIKKIGGHSVGSCVVLCDCNQRSYLLCGDECYVKECFVKNIPTGISCDTRVSEEFLSEYGSGKYDLLLFHDPEIMRGHIGYALVEGDGNMQM